MDSMPRDIADLFDAATATRDATGCLHCVAELLAASEAALLLLADGTGEVLAADVFSLGIDMAAVPSLARQMVQRLAADEACHWECTVGDRRRLAFALRLPPSAERAVLGGLLRRGRGNEEELRRQHGALLSCGALAWIAQRTSVESRRLQARLDQLVSEQDTLRASHSEAVTVAIEEREQRLCEEQEHRTHLEELVEERTADLATANKNLEQMCRAAEQANSAKSTFLANMSHELRTPLHGMLSFAAFGVKDAQKNSLTDMLNYFQKIETCGKTLLTLINDLLDLAKLEAGRTTFDFGQVDLRSLLLQVADECSSRVAQRNIKFVLPPRDAVTDAVAVGDPVKLGQVVRNLMDNAIKFSPDGSAIELGIERTPRTFRVSIADRGVGIPESELEAIFDKFIQSSKTRTTAGGTGLGLAICREIIAAHKGRVWANNRPDGGAVMTFEVPVNLHEVGAAGRNSSVECGDSSPLCAAANESGKTDPQ
jgi:signal transduction histidine kinase